jgi:hypothetical protein
MGLNSNLDVCRYVLQTKLCVLTKRICTTSIVLPSHFTGANLELQVIKVYPFE